MFTIRHWREFLLFLTAVALAGCSHQQKAPPNKWNPRAAAAYLDQREITWMGWPGAARDHDTFCVSCHTVLPYVLSRPALRPALAEPGESDDERKIFDNVAKRVRLWNEVGPYYTDREYDRAKPVESRGTEAVLNALILSANDAQTGKLSDVTRTAFANMWAAQTTDGDGKGSWPWLRFGMEPWEANDSAYYGATLAALAVGTAPEQYRSSSDIQAQLNSLRDYLNAKYATQSVLNHAALLLASTKVPDLVEADRRKAIVQELLAAQRDDGGWKLSSLSWPSGWSLRSIVRKRLRSDWTQQNSGSDGYATGFITFVLQQAGMQAERDAPVKRGLIWLASSQNPSDGSWPSVSLTQRRKDSSNVGHFMRDAATAYAVLALTTSSGAPDQKLDGNGALHDGSAPRNARLEVGKPGK